MGNWHISIQGTGCHHNYSSDDEWREAHDADVIFQRFVRELQDAGQSVEFATITTGGRTDAAVRV